MPAHPTSPEQRSRRGTFTSKAGRWARKRANTFSLVLLLMAAKYTVPPPWAWALSWVTVGLVGCRLGMALLRDRPSSESVILRHVAAAVLLILIAMPRTARSGLIENGAIALPIAILALHIIVGVVRGIRQARSASADLRKRVTAFLSCLVPERLAAFAATDINLLSYVIPGLRRRHVPPGHLAFDYHKQIRPILLAFICLGAIEAVAGHLMLIHTAPVIRWTVFVISDLGLLYFVALAASLSKLPLLVSTDHVLVRAGIFIELEIPVDAIAYVRGSPSEAERRRPGSVNTALMSQPSVVIELSRQIVASIPLKGQRKVWRAGVRPDDPIAFISAVEAATAAHPSNGRRSVGP